MSESSPSMAAAEWIDPSVRVALQLAIAAHEVVAVVLRTRPTGESRVIEGTPTYLAQGPDGRERVFISVAEGTQQIVLLSRISRVVTIPT